MKLLSKGKHRDEVFAEATVAARTAHEKAMAAAAKERTDAITAAEAELEVAQQRHDAAVTAAKQRAELAERQAHAELARATKLTTDAWNREERAALGVPEAAFVRRTPEGWLHVHGTAGMPPAARAFHRGHGTWEIRTETGVQFAGGEVQARRLMWKALVKARDEQESGDLAG